MHISWFQSILVCYMLRLYPPTPSHSHPNPHPSDPLRSPYPNEAPSYSGYDFLPDFVPECCSLFDLQALMIAHSLDANSPPLHADAKSSVAKQPHIVIGHYWEAQQRWCYPFKCWSRIFAGLDRCHHFSCWCSSTSRCKVITRHKHGYHSTCFPHASLSKFNWQSLALFWSCKISR